MLKKSFRVKFVVLALLVVLVAVSIPSLASALTAPEAPPKLNWWNCFTSPVSCAIFGITLAVNAIMQLFIALGAFLVNTVLEFSIDIVNLTAVQTGFKVSLAIANLGFVLGIIVIALSTILHRQSYGIKQILWKLVVAAIVVNFGLSIAGMMLGVSDTFTKYFTDALGGNGNFVNRLTGAFGPNHFTAPPRPDNGGLDPACKLICVESSCATICDIADAAAKKAAEAKGDAALSDADYFIKTVLALVFVIIFNFVIAFTLLALAIMLLIRLITIAFLLILLPLAWLMWIFPKFSHLNGQWWGSFLRWAFFPAIVTFFLYLAIMTAQGPPTILPSNTALPAGTPAEALGIQTNAPGPIAAAANGILIIGLALGGLFAANKMSITGASVAMGTMKGMGKATGGWFAKTGARRTLSLASRAIRPSPSPTRAPLHPIPATHHPPATPPPGTPPPGTPPTTPPPGAPSATTSTHPPGTPPPIFWTPTTPGVPPTAPPPPTPPPGTPPTTPGASPTTPPTTPPPTTHGATPVGWRGKAADWLEAQAKHPALKTKGFFRTVYEGAKNGSGLFRGSKTFGWECQNCASAGHVPPQIIYTKKKPQINCPTCHAAPNIAKWTQA